MLDRTLPRSLTERDLFHRWAALAGDRSTRRIRLIGHAAALQIAEKGSVRLRSNHQAGHFTRRGSRLGAAVGNGRRNGPGHHL